MELAVNSKTACRMDIHSWRLNSILPPVNGPLKKEDGLANVFKLNFHSVGMKVQCTNIDRLP